MREVTHIEELRESLRLLRNARVAKMTEKGYAHDWRKFAAWCAAMELQPLPATEDTVLLFIADQLRTKRVVTVCRYVYGIAYRHRLEALPSILTGEVIETLRGARRMLRETPRQMRPLSVKEIRRIAEVLALSDTPGSLRDRAIVLLGFASALRRYNLAALDLADISYCAEGLVIQVRHEKQDQEGEGRLIPVPRGEHPGSCPVRCLDTWLSHRGPGDGPLFTRVDPGAPPLARLSVNAVGNIVKWAVEKGGLDSAEYGAHSLRSGLITEAGLANVNHLAIAAQSGHRSLGTLQRYFRPLDLFRGNVVAAIGL